MSICQFVVFCRNGSIVLFWFLAQCYIIEISNTGRVLFSMKRNLFCPNLGKKGLKWSQNSFFGIFWKILWLVFLENNLKWKLILLLIFHHQSNIWQNSGSWVMGQNAISQSDCRILWNVISQEKWMRKYVFGMQINVEVFYKLILSFCMCATRHVQSTQSKKLAYLCNIFRKARGWSWFFCLHINKS